MTITQPIPDALTIQQIAGLEPGWHSDVDIAWQLVGDSFEARSEIKKALGALYRAGKLERLYLFHANHVLPCYLIDSARLSTLAEAES